MTTPRTLFICDGAPVPPDLAEQPGLVTRRLTAQGSEADLNLRLDNVSAAMLTSVSERAAALVHIAAYVYGADQGLSRGGTADIVGRHWRRDLVLCIPVADPEFWSQGPIRAKLATVLAFLTEDRWGFEFGPASGERQPLTLDLPRQQVYGNPDRVILLSGGADSLCAAVRAVADDGRSPLLVSHRSTPPLDARQQALVAQLQQAFPSWGFPHVSFWIHRKGSDAPDSSQRSRAFLFAALGAAVASELAIAEVDLADNGVVSLNLPINAQLVGALASRSTHPKFIASFNELSAAVLPGAPRVVNPLWDRTRAEALAILKGAGVESLLQETVSCSRTRGRPRAQPQCGYCYQCVDRRFGTTAAGLEEHDLAERYGLDIFTSPLPEGEPLTVAESYVRFARQVAETSAEELFLAFPQLQDCVVEADPNAPQTARVLAELLRRHADSALSVAADMIGRHQFDLAAGRLEGSLLRLIAGDPHSKTPTSAPDVCEFRRNGKLRVITFGGTTIPLADTQGLRYIAHLLSRPWDGLHVLELVALERGDDPGARHPVVEAFSAGLTPSGLSSVDTEIDDRARDEVLAELHPLRARREDAAELGNDAEVAEIDAKIDKLTAYVRRSTSPSGRRRQFRGEDARARESVSKAINRGLKAIRAAHQELGQHLDRFLHTGWTCSYDPDPRLYWVT